MVTMIAAKAELSFEVLIRQLVHEKAMIFL